MHIQTVNKHLKFVFVKANFFFFIKNEYLLDQTTTGNVLS